MTVVCETRSISRSFGGVHAVRDVSITLESGTLYGLIGPNGAGKSTLIDLISGRRRADTGQVLLAGDDVTKKPAFMRAREGLGRTFQATRLPKTLTVRETVLGTSLIAERSSAIGYFLRTPHTRRAHRTAATRTLQVLEMVGLDRYADLRVEHLSYADQRRLEVARALALQPKVLFLDEPTAGTHVEDLPSFAALLRELAGSTMAVVLVEHNVEFMRSTVQKLYAMELGSIIAFGEPEEVLRHPTVVESYLGDSSD